MDRKKLSVLNSSLSIVNMIVTNLLAFVYRTALVKIMGAEYVGITGLFTNLLSVFCLADLGITWAITFYLYKPLKENNQEQVAAIINLLRKFYKYIAIVILVAGVICTLFLQYIIKSEHPIEHMYLIYAMFLANTVLSYLFFAYYQILLAGDRKNYLTFKPRVIVPVVCTTLQICSIYFLHNFLLAVLFICSSTFLQNLWIARVARKEYSYLNDYKDAEVGADLKKNIYNYIKATMVYKVSMTVLQSSTSLIISSFIGIAVLGIYSNFMLIVDTIKGFVLNAIHPMTAIIGEINAGETTEYKKSIFKRLNFLMDWVCVFCSTCFVVLLKPFVTLWLGHEFLLPMSTIILIVTYFFFEFLTAFSTKYRDACGLNNYGKYRPLVTAVINVVLSLSLVGRFGIDGILFSMIFSRVATITWFEPWIIYRHVFKQSVFEYYKECVAVVALALLSGSITYFAFNWIWQESWLTFVLGTLVCLLIPNILFVLFTHRNEDFRYYVSLVSARIKK